MFGTVITFKFVNTCGCVFFMFGVVCDFVSEVSFEGVVCGICYVVIQFFFNTFTYFLCGFVGMSECYEFFVCVSFFLIGL